ncbi:MAG TPA: hypothetical protein VHS56_10800 [Candidatus Cybelea sp.]|nr:hypothetical protein [Candidatus Cybelea sp.]
MDEKRFRFDLLVALGALLISGVAAASSAYQTYVIRKQFSATVWPYLTFITSSSTGKFFELDVDNPGIGPALIITSTVTRDGKVVNQPSGPNVVPAVGAALQPERDEAASAERNSHEHGNNDMTASTIQPGDVLPAGQKLELLRVEGKFLTGPILANFHRVNVALCYCSLLGDCWTKRLSDQAIKPRPVRSCTATS